MRTDDAFFHSRSSRLWISAAAVFLGVAIAKTYGLSGLLLCMMIGGTFADMRNDAMDVRDNVEAWTQPLFMLFFVIPGAELDVTAIQAAVLCAALIYVL